MKKRIYISGMIAHMDLEERRTSFKRAAEQLERKGFEVINPFENGLSQEADWHDHMRIDIRNLTHCDYIYMLRGWEHSKGAKLEMDVASSCGITVVMESDNKSLLQAFE